MKKVIIISLIIFWFLPSFAKMKVKTVEGEYVMMLTSEHTESQLKEELIRNAKIEALNNAFGNTINISNTTIVTESSEKYHSISFDSVKGEWIKTIGEPEITKYFENNNLFFKCRIRGRARAKNSVATDLLIKVLRNGVTADCESSSFRNGNRMYILFQTPEDGFVSVFLHDPLNDTVYCLLPYKKQSTGCFEVEHDKEYVFFSKEKSETPSLVVPCMLTCGEEPEVNTLYVVYSRNRFSKPIISRGDKRTHDNLTFKDFNKWIATCMSDDEDFQRISKTIIIE